MKDTMLLIASWKSIYEPSHNLNTAKHTINFQGGIVLEPDASYEIAFDSIDTYYSFPNIIEGTNNKFAYKKGGTKTVLSLPTGCYSIETINSTIKEMLSNDKDKMSITSVIPQLKSAIEVAPNFAVDFTEPNSINTVLGFNARVLEHGFNISDNIVNINRTNTIFINCDLVASSYVNETRQPVIYSFFPNVPPGYKIVEVTPRLTFLPINRSRLDSITVWLSNQDNELINLRNDVVTVRFQIRKRS